VLAAFAPRALHELLLLLPRVRTLPELRGQVAVDFAQMLSRLLMVYGRTLGVGSFNLVSYSAPLDSQPAGAGGSDDWQLHFKLIARPAPRSLYTSDCGPLERMYDAWVVDSVPEQLAKTVSDALAALPASAQQ